MNPTAQQEIEHHTQIGADVLNVCILDSQPAVVDMLQQMIESLGYAAHGASDPRVALEQISKRACRVVICDARMPSMNGLPFLETALQRDPGVYVILLTGCYTTESALDALRRGAYDYLAKPVDRATLRRTLQDLQAVFQQRRRIRQLDQRLLADLEFHGIIGRSPAMLEVFDLVRKITRHYTNVLLVGETGTDKELIARALHQISPVANQTFEVCNCSGVTDPLLESRLFGHFHGAFNGASETRPGLFEYVQGGTVFLDEVGETSLPMQAKLLCVIQNREIQRMGAPEVRRVDVRIIAGTNRDLRAEVAAGRFREDLSYRLSTIQIRVPALIERLDDIPSLVNFFVKKYNAAYEKQVQGLTRRAQAILLRYAWPGDVRELENVISSASMVTVKTFIDLEDLPASLKRPSLAAAADAWQPLPLDDIRKEHIRRVLDVCGGNRVKTAHILGIGRTSLYRYLKREHKNGIHTVRSS